MKWVYSLCFIILFSMIIGTEGQCKTNADCNMNGVCTGGYCSCDYGWGGGRCTFLIFKPAPIVSPYGYSPNVTAWGGLPVLSEDDNLYHLFIAEMVNHCGVCTWYTNSRVVHAISKNLLGPYTFNDVSLEVWAHNPHILVDRSGKDPIYLLFHIGYADGGVSPIVCNATNYTSSISSYASSKHRAKQLNQASYMLHTSYSPYGPWTPQNPPGFQNYKCNNPAPYVFPNGSIILVCNEGPLWRGDDLGSIFSAPSWRGPWTIGSLNYTGNAGDGAWEDPFIWVDSRGVYKLIAHVYPDDTRVGFTARCSGQAYSLDGFNWVVSPEAPYSCVVQHVNGLAAYTTRERPKLFFDPIDGSTPLALFNAVAEGNNCWDCKETCGVDWGHNIAVPIAP